MSIPESLSEINSIRWTPERYSALSDYLQHGVALSHHHGSSSTDGGFSARQSRFLERSRDRFSPEEQRRHGEEGQHRAIRFDGKLIVQRSAVQQVLERCYRQVSAEPAGMSRNRLYSRVCSEVCGVTRREVERFLAEKKKKRKPRGQEEQQEQQGEEVAASAAVHLRPIRCWQLATLTLSEGARRSHGYSHVLVALDCTNMRAEAVPMQDDGAASVRTAMRSILLLAGSGPASTLADKRRAADPDWLARLTEALRERLESATPARSDDGSYLSALVRETEAHC